VCERVRRKNEGSRIARVRELDSGDCPILYTIVNPLTNPNLTSASTSCSSALILCMLTGRPDAFRPGELGSLFLKGP
jgi:hypothetical protein